MKQDIIYLIPDEYAIKRLNRKFEDTRIVYGWNKKNQRRELWYKPEKHRPFMIGSPVNVPHAEKLLEGRARYDRMRAKNLISKIDEQNEKQANRQKDDAVYHFKREMYKIMSGKKHFLPSKVNI